MRNSQGHEKKRIFEKISVALASGLAIEASVHKPGTSSPIKSAKGLYHHGFVIASMMISHAIEDLLLEIDSAESECFDLGHIVRELYLRGEEVHGMGNLHLGFVILLTPVVPVIPKFLRRNIYYDSYDGINLLTLRDYEDLLKKATEYLIKCGKKSRVSEIFNILKRVYGTKIYLHEGPTPDLYREEDSVRSMWDLVCYGRYTDIILRELYSGYEITRGYSKKIIASSDQELYNVIQEIFLEIILTYLDTNIVRSSSITKALFFRNSLKICIGMKEVSDEAYNKCINFFDELYRKLNINPGSIADLIAFMISLRNLVKLSGV